MKSAQVSAPSKISGLKSCRAVNPSSLREIDRSVLPSYFSKVDPKRRTPVRALAFVAAMAFIGSFFGRTVLGWFVDLLSLGVLVAYGYTALAVIHCARRDRSPAWIALGVLGAALTALFLVLFLIPGLGTPTSEESYIILIAWIALGVNFYKPTFN